MPLSQRDTDHVFQCLRGGTVPERGLETFAVGIERERGELHRMLDLTVEEGEGTSCKPLELRDFVGCAPLPLLGEPGNNSQEQALQPGLRRYSCL
jgi:hypothetical protein